MKHQFLRISSTSLNSNIIKKVGTNRKIIKGIIHNRQYSFLSVFGDGTGHSFTEGISKEKMGGLFSFFLPHFHLHQLLRCSWEQSHLDRTTGHHNGLTQQNQAKFFHWAWISFASWKFCSVPAKCGIRVKLLLNKNWESG